MRATMIMLLLVSGHDRKRKQPRQSCFPPSPSPLQPIRILPRKMAEESKGGEPNVDFLLKYLQRICSPILFASDEEEDGKLEAALNASGNKPALNKFAIDNEVVVLVVDLNSEGGERLVHACFNKSLSFCTTETNFTFSL